MAENRGTRPLMVYTSLIFIVAIIMVVVAFFGQRHLESAQLRQTETAIGISERASQLSDENRLLMEKNKQLTSENSDITEENATLSSENERLTKENEAFGKLNEIYMMIYKGNKANARKALKEIYTEDLTAEQKEFYDVLVKRSE
jgi:hypothetical protein